MNNKKLQEVGNDDVESVELYYEGNHYFDLEDFILAKEILLKAQQLCSLNNKEYFVKIRLLLSRCCRKLQYYAPFCNSLEEAEKYMKEAYEACLDSKDVNAEMGRLYYDFAKRLNLKLKQYIEKRARYLDLIEDSAGAFKVNMEKRLAKLDTKFNKFEKYLLNSISFLKNAVKIDPDNLHYKYELGHVIYLFRFLYCSPERQKEFGKNHYKLFEEILAKDGAFNNYHRNRLFEKIRESKTLVDKNG